MSLPAVTEEPHFHYASFRVKGKIFVTAPPEGTYIHVFAPDAAREVALETEPECVEKLWWGTKVVGLRVTLANARPPFVGNLVKDAWSAKAPKKLAAACEG